MAYTDDALRAGVSQRRARGVSRATRSVMCRGDGAPCETGPFPDMRANDSQHGSDTCARRAGFSARVARDKREQTPDGRVHARPRRVGRRRGTDPTTLGRRADACIRDAASARAAPRPPRLGRPAAATRRSARAPARPCGSRSEQTRPARSRLVRRTRLVSVGDRRLQAGDSSSASVIAAAGKPRRPVAGSRECGQVSSSGSPSRKR
jgi:hypothetical protein